MQQSRPANIASGQSRLVFHKPPASSTCLPWVGFSKRVVLRGHLGVLHMPSLEVGQAKLVQSTQLISRPIACPACAEFHGGILFESQGKLVLPRIEFSTSKLAQHSPRKYRVEIPRVPRLSWICPDRPKRLGTSLTRHRVLVYRVARAWPPHQ